MVVFTRPRRDIGLRYLRMRSFARESVRADVFSSEWKSRLLTVNDGFDKLFKWIVRPGEISLCRCGTAGRGVRVGRPDLVNCPRRPVSCDSKLKMGEKGGAGKAEGEKESSVFTRCPAFRGPREARAFLHTWEASCKRWCNRGYNTDANFSRQQLAYNYTLLYLVLRVYKSMPERFTFLAFFPLVSHSFARPSGGIAITGMAQVFLLLYEAPWISMWTVYRPSRYTRWEWRYAIAISNGH